MKSMKHIHFIGICGVAMSALAIAFHKKGYRVTGSDVGFYPPISTHLEKQGVSYYAGWHPEKVLAEFVSKNSNDEYLVIVGNVASSNNPEWLFVKENGIPYLSYPEAVATFFVREHSIVAAGTYGKTTSTTLLTWILAQAGFDPSYMFGGLTIDPTDAAAITESSWSILEGDEYKSSRFDLRPKFSHYKPTHLLLTGMSWDHVDVYPTEESYVEAFTTLIAGMPKQGLIVANQDDSRVESLTKTFTGTRITYGMGPEANVRYSSIEQKKSGLTFTITADEKEWVVTSPMLGAYQAANITGCFALARAIGISPEKIIASIASFSGIKRRLEKRLADPVTIFDDIAHSPAKAASVLQTLRELTSGKLIAVFEPNSGNREESAKPLYTHAFDHADEVIIPRLTNIKIDLTKKERPMDGETLTEVIAQTHKNVHHIDDDEQLVTHLKKTARPNDCIVFLGSHGFRGMIEQTVELFAKN